MQEALKTICLPLPFRMGNVNCYLIQTGEGYILIDTGGANSRKRLVDELESAYCRPGLLKLIILTHGDFDHIGNADFLRRNFGAKIAMHADDSGMAQRGDMFVNRKKPTLFIRSLLSLFLKIVSSERFTPDLLLQDGDELSEYGLSARVISITGHSLGSIGILTAGGSFFCGDLLVNNNKPGLGPLIDDYPAAHASVEKLGHLNIGTVYPGHGKPFPLKQISPA